MRGGRRKDALLLERQALMREREDTIAGYLQQFVEREMRGEVVMVDGENAPMLGDRALGVAGFVERLCEVLAQRDDRRERFDPAPEGVDRLGQLSSGAQLDARRVPLRWSLVHDARFRSLAPKHRPEAMKIPFPKRRVSRDVALRELAILERTYPSAITALHYSNPFELLIAVILSAQCTDARVNLTTPQLFAKYPTAAKLARAKPEDVERIIHSCGFYRMKAKSIISAASDLASKHGGEVPSSREELEDLAGVGRKTANVVMSVAFGEAAFAVDTHVFRVSHRLGLSLGTTPRAVEEDVTALVPKEKWRHAHHWLILHGREICKAPTPRCGECPLNEICPTPPIIAKLATVKARSRK